MRNAIFSSLTILYYLSNHSKFTWLWTGGVRPGTQKATGDYLAQLIESSDEAQEAAERVMVHFGQISHIFHTEDQKWEFDATDRSLCTKAFRKIIILCAEQDPVINKTVKVYWDQRIFSLLPDHILKLISEIYRESHAEKPLPPSGPDFN
jgi:hypothetical protein